MARDSRSHDAMRVLITLQDVEPAVRLNARLESEGVVTDVVSPIDDMRAAIARAKPDVIVFTGDLSSAPVLTLARDQLWSGAACVGLADVGDPAHLERMRAAGFTELYVKPVNVDDVVAGLRRILERRRLQQAVGLYGESAALREVLVKVEQMAPVSSTVLIEGESGTGKELVARALHRLSPRRNQPFIPVNVGALPETLLESELFGHEKGAFTGAAERRLGRFELADGGTIFLDEIGEIPMATQVKLLRVLEEREIVRLGGTAPIHVDVRVVAATNRPLREHVAEGSFRADLYFRLNVLNIYLPPLRERREDVPLLVRRFIQQLSQEHDRRFHGIDADAMRLLMDYPWPGNVRELRNLVESMVVLSPGHEIHPDDLPRQIREGGLSRFLPVPVPRAPDRMEIPVQMGGAMGHELELIVRSLLELRLQVEELRHRMDEQRQNLPGAGFIGEIPAPGGIPTAALPPRDDEPPPNVVTITPGTRMADIERRVIEAALRETGGNRRRAAELLGIGERTLYRKIKEYRVGEDALTSS